MGTIAIGLITIIAMSFIMLCVGINIGYRIGVRRHQAVGISAMRFLNRVVNSLPAEDQDDANQLVTRYRIELELR